MNVTDADLAKLSDPLVFGRLLWPDVRFFKQQRETIYSVRDNDETYCRAGNELGVQPPVGVR